MAAADTSPNPRLIVHGYCFFFFFLPFPCCSSSLGSCCARAWSPPPHGMAAQVLVARSSRWRISLHCGDTPGSRVLADTKPRVGSVWVYKSFHGKFHGWSDETRHLGQFLKHARFPQHHQVVRGVALQHPIRIKEKKNPKWGKWRQLKWEFVGEPCFARPRGAI